MKAIQTILIVDDDLDDQELLRDAIKLIDPAILRLYSFTGDQALRLLLSPSMPIPDCIFLDLNMPGMNGKECLKQIKSKAIIRTIPVIILSSEKTPEEEVEMKKWGAAAYFQKPSDFRVLCEIVEQVLSGKFQL